MPRPQSYPALAGLLGPLAYLSGIAVASQAQQDFMASYGWSIWPAGLRLGPHGWLWTATVIAFGVLLLTFAVAVASNPVRSPVVGSLLALAGAAALLSAWPTDLVERGSGFATANLFAGETQTWQGSLHAVGGVGLLLSLLIGYIPLWRKARLLPGWRQTRTSAAWALLLLVPAAALPDPHALGGYAFLVVILAPLAVLGSRLAARTD